MQTFKLFQVDAFTSRLFGGNPAAVVPLERWLDDTLLANIAAENNLSETAFFTRVDDHYHIRWFTPTAEIDLCGHATLATAHVIFHELETRATELHFESRSGLLKVGRTEDLITLDFPAETLIPAEITAEVIAALGIRPREYYPGKYHVAVLSNAEEVRTLSPNLSLLERLPGVGVIVTAPGKTTDFVSRFFAPQIGIPEDPVTGAAHCYLTPYWAQRLGKTTLSARQISKRGGDLGVSLVGSRVHLSGNARLYKRGEIFLD